MPDPGVPSEGALLSAWFDHRDEGAAEQLWRRYQRLAVAVGARILRGRPGALDEARGLADEMFVRALHRWDRERAAENSTPFRSFYVTLVKNAALDQARRLRPVRLVDEVPDPGADPRAALHGAITLRASLPRVREFLEREFLPGDVALFERWLEETADGGRIPWTAWAREFPVRVDEVVRFDLQDASPPEASELEVVARTLTLCPKIQLVVRGTASPEEDAALASQRAAAVVAALQGGLNPRTTRDEVGASVPRLVARAASERGTPRVDFEVTLGATRTAAALRMRVTAVLLPAVRAVFEESKR